MSWTNIFMVPLVMACAFCGTVGLIWLIRRYHNWSDKNKNTEQQ